MCEDDEVILTCGVLVTDGHDEVLNDESILAVAETDTLFVCRAELTPLLDDVDDEVELLLREGDVVPVRDP